MKLIQASSESRIDDVQALFEHWRNTRKKRGAIPDELWQAAVSLYPAYPLQRISKTLRLNYGKLKDHFQGQSPNLSMLAAEAFVELDFGQPSPSCQCIVEMYHRNGSKMTTQVTNGSLDPIKLAELFWNQP